VGCAPGALVGRELLDRASMSAVIERPVAELCLARLAELKEEFDRRAHWGMTRQELAWQGLPKQDKKLLLTLAGVASLDQVEALAAKQYKELTPPERGSVATAVRYVQRLGNKAAVLGAIGAGVA
jgi:hypothetical protein